MPSPYLRDDMTGRIKSAGWSVVADKDQTVEGTLQALSMSREKLESGKRPGRLDKAATGIPLEVRQIQSLCRYLDLPG